MDLLTKQDERFLLAIYHLNVPACLLTIRDHLKEQTGKDWAFGSLYVTLKKLRNSGCVEVRSGESSAIRGGKAVQYYTLTSDGMSALNQAKSVHDRMWADFSADATTTGQSNEQ